MLVGCMAHADISSLFMHRYGNVRSRFFLVLYTSLARSRSVFRKRRWASIEIRRPLTAKGTTNRRERNRKILFPFRLRSPCPIAENHCPQLRFRRSNVQIEISHVLFQPIT